MKPPSCSLFPRGEGRGEGQRRSQTIIRDYRNGRDLTGTPRGVKVIDLFGLIAQLVRERFPAVYQPLLEPAHLVTGRLRAYGLGPGQSTDALLTHLVALNAQRAGEEKAGHVRWLRPEFQSPALATLLLNKELVTPASQAVQADLALNLPSDDVSAALTGSQATQAWPAALPDQVRAVAQVLASANTALPQSAIEARFKGRGAWKKSLPRILDTLEAMGRARREGDGWRS